MPGRYGRLMPGIMVAVALALAGGVPRIGGVETWKILLAALGLALIVAAGRKPDVR